MSNHLKYKKAISKEEISELELSKYSGNIILVENKEALNNAAQEIKKCHILGIDTETKPSFKKGKLNPVALLQIATDKCVYIIRLNKVALSKDFAEIFQSQDIIKVGIAVIDDFKDLKKMIPFTPHKVIDLNLLAPKLGFENIGAKKLSALVLGFRISKRQQVSNWEAEPLSQAQIDYAATDAWICREVYLRIK